MPVEPIEAALPVMLHVPPVVPSVKVAGAPIHILAGPLITPGNALIVTFLLTAQLLVAYVMLTVPALTPVTSPDPSTDPMAVLLLLQVPPATPSVSVMPLPAHKLPAPFITDGPAFAVTVEVTEQLAPIV